MSSLSLVEDLYVLSGLLVSIPLSVKKNPDFICTPRNTSVRCDWHQQAPNSTMFYKGMTILKCLRSYEYVESN